MPRPDGKPFCPCGKTKLSNLSPDLQLKWASSENEKWFRLETQNLAYFRYCKDCHKLRWKDDKRQQGPHCTPAPPQWARWQETANGVSRLLSGEFFLTRAPPELSRTGLPGAGSSAARPRSRSPARAPAPEARVARTKIVTGAGSSAARPRRWGPRG